MKSAMPSKPNLSIQCPTPTEEWTAIAEQFEKRWKFPHCYGALDNKHVMVTCPWNTGSLYRNYKGFFSIVLMALVDADYKFLWIDVDSDGSTNDASIYNRLKLKEDGKSEQYIQYPWKEVFTWWWRSYPILHSRGQCVWDPQEPDKPIFYQKHGVPRK